MEIVATHEEAARLALAPLLVVEPLRAWLDGQGLGSGRLEAARIGGGQSNVTYLVERDGGVRFVLRRGPRPPLPPSAHDMVREASLQRSLYPAGARVPEILAICADESVLGVPFYVMSFVAGDVVTTAMPPRLDTPAGRAATATELVESLAEIHAVDYRAAGLDWLGKPTGYLERQVRRFAGLWEVNATRELPQVGELATIGDPLADVGYLVSTWAGSPLALSPVTRLEGFPGRDELATIYEARSGRSMRDLGWYEALALWKSAVFCEAIYGRHLRGERGPDDPFGRSLERGVPALLEAAEVAAKG